MKNLIALMFLLTSTNMMAANTKKELTPTKLFLNWKAEPEFGGFYTAQVNKLYEKNGLQTEIIEGGAGTPTVQMIASGQAEFGIVSGDEIILSRANGGKVVALFTVFQKSPYAFMLRADSKINSIKDLYASTNTVSMMKGLPFAAFLDQKYPNKKIKTVPYTGGISTFINDSTFVQQCFISSEPLLAEKQNIKTKTFLVADEGFNPYTAVLSTNEETLKNKPEVVKAMVKAVQQGWAAYLKNQTATHEAIVKLNPSMTMDSMKGIQKTEAALIANAETKKNGLGSMTEKRWSELSQQMKDLGLTKALIPASEVYKNF